jgi:hypothetical protein
MKKSLKYQIEEISDVELTFRNLSLLEYQNFTREQVEIQLSGNETIDRDNNRITFMITSYYWLNVGDSREKILHYVMKMVYAFEDLEFVVDFQSEDTWQIPSQIMGILLGPAISTMRGMLVAKTANTNLSKIYLPIINLQNLIDQRMASTDIDSQK